MKMRTRNWNEASREQLDKLVHLTSFLQSKCLVVFSYHILNDLHLSNLTHLQPQESYKYNWKVIKGITNDGQ